LHRAGSLSHCSLIYLEVLTVDNIRVRLAIEGRVQGVWFRESTRREAARLGVRGWVRNRREGTVEVVAEGPEDMVRKLAEWCHHGPPSARVTRVRETPEAFQGEFSSFEVEYSY
jgi:acylphosphatase